jgi:hypothetical protein
MIASPPIDVTRGNKRRQSLLQKLLQQRGASIFGKGGGTGLPGGVRQAGLHRSALPNIARASRVMPSVLGALGPGGHGRPGAPEYNPGGRPLDRGSAPNIGPITSPINSPMQPGPPAVGAPMGGVPTGTLAPPPPGDSGPEYALPGDYEGSPLATRGTAINLQYPELVNSFDPNLGWSFDPFNGWKAVPVGAMSRAL